MENYTPTTHSALVYQIKKSRGINWNPKEKEYLLYLCSQRVGVIEDKKSDLLTLSKKAAAWKFIHNKFSARFGRKRTPIRIKEQWKRMKIAARAELRDRGIIPEIGASPVDPNATTNKYYGESLDIISKVQEILFSENPPTLVFNSGDDEGFNVPFSIKTEPIDDNVEMASSYSDSLVSPEDFLPNNCNPVQTEERSMFVFNNQQLLSQQPGMQSGVNDGELPKNTTESRECHVVNIDSEVSHSNMYIKNIVSGPVPTNSMNKSSGLIQSEFGSSADDNISKSHVQSNRVLRLSKSFEDQLLEYSRIEHARKMEIMEKEHALQMEILTMQREVASSKLKKANFKLQRSRNCLP